MNGKHHHLALPLSTTIGAGSKRLTVNEEFKRGGFGIIYKGLYQEDDHIEEKIVAIKEYLPEEYATRSGGTDVVVVPGKEKDFEEGLEWFRREAEILDDCKRPNIVSFYDIFEANKTAYIVMEFVAGRDWSEHLKDKRKPQEAELKDILCPLLDALEVVHQKGFVHRDIKPSNIVLRSNGSPVLLDFGSAQPIGKNQKVLVTDSYSPPEQYDEQGRQGPWTDIYALGAVCYEALTDDPPQNGERDPDRDLGIFTFNKKGESTKFCQAIDKALEIEPDKRPQTVEQWKEMMEQPEPTPAVVSPLEPLEKEAVDAVSPPEPLEKEAAAVVPPPESPEPQAVDAVPPTKPSEPSPSKKSWFMSRWTLLIVSLWVIASLGVIGVKKYEEYKVDKIAELEQQAELKRKQEQAEQAEQAELDIFREEVRREPRPSGKFKGETDLHITARLNLPILTMRLLKEGADVAAKDNNGNTPLLSAVFEDAAAAVEEVFKFSKEAQKKIHAKDNNGDTLLHWAVKEDATATVEVLLDRGADVAVKDKNGGTPLHWAAFLRSHEIVKVLLDRGADVAVKDKNGGTPLHWAIGHTPLHLAMEPHHDRRTEDKTSAVVRVLIAEEHADVNAKNNAGDTPLHWALKRGAPLEVTKVLLDSRKVDVNAKNDNGDTPLHLAAKDGALEAVRVLLDSRKVDINAKNNAGDTPEDVASTTNVKILLADYQLRRTVEEIRSK